MGGEAGRLVVYRSRTRGWQGVALGLLLLGGGYGLSGSVASANGVGLAVAYLVLAALGGCLVLGGLWFALGRKVTMIVAPDSLTLGQTWGGRQDLLGWDEIAGIEVVTQRYRAATVRHLSLMLTDAAARRLGKRGRRRGGFIAHVHYTDAHLSVGVYALADSLVARATAAGRVVTGPVVPYGGAINDHRRWLMTDAPLRDRG